jgi:glutathione-regulated potassium-efflux system ancillary protein KefG
MKSILVIFAHPRFEKSRTNAVLLKNISHLSHVTVRDLYQEYPEYNIDIQREKELLLGHDIIIWHHPFFWYSCPPLLKQWIDVVLEIGWAYGPGGTALKGKLVFNAITTGGAREAYTREGRNRYTLREFLVPFEQTARLCQMTYLPPFAVQGTHRLTPEAIDRCGKEYALLLSRLTEDSLSIEHLLTLDSLNDEVRGQFTEG